jgi:hypothetical protein
MTGTDRCKNASASDYICGLAQRLFGMTCVISRPGFQRRESGVNEREYNGREEYGLTDYPDRRV